MFIIKQIFYFLIFLMSKRPREVITTVRPSLASLPYSTLDGGRWLKKALDPVDINTEIIGLPDINTNQRAILNYQMQDDIPVPRSETFNPNVMQSYDADLYLYQDPIVYGTSISYPQGTKNPADYPITINVTHDSEGMHLDITLSSGTAPRTTRTFYNNQIEGDTPAQKLKSLEKYCQRSRLIYGGIQAIPACSALFDSGTIEATQQIFSPENKLINDCEVSGYQLKSLRTQIFKENDFPDEGSSIQNATSLYCRYKEGLYMPYKLVNPLVYPYKGSEEKTLIEAPYVFTGIYEVYITSEQVDGSTPERVHLHPTYQVESNSYHLDYAQPTLNIINNIYIYLSYVNKFGQDFTVCASYEMTPSETPAPSNFNMVIQGPKTVGSYPHVLGGDGFIASKTETRDTLKCNNISIGTKMSTAELPAMLPQLNNNIGIVCFRSIGLQASVRLIFRVGLEMMIVAGGIYSPFKHKAPNYDQKALNSYVRACHSMRDAFLGNAATPEGHDDYAAHIAEIVAADDSGNVSNMGSRWYGKVSV